MTCVNGCCCCVGQMEFEDVAPLKKLRVTVDTKSGTRKSWYLEKVGLLYVQLYAFLYTDCTVRVRLSTFVCFCSL